MISSGPFPENNNLMQINKKQQQLNVTAEWISHLRCIQKSWFAISDTGYSD